MRIRRNYLKQFGMTMKRTPDGGYEIIRIKKPKTKKMQKLKQYLNTFYWYDQTSKELLDATPMPLMPLEYPTTFRTTFGNAPALFLKIVDKVLPQRSRSKFEKYLISE